MYLDAIVDNDKKTGDNGLRRILEIETKPDGKRLYDYALGNQDMLALIKSKIIDVQTIVISLFVYKNRLTDGNMGDDDENSNRHKEENFLHDQWKVSNVY